MSNEAVVALSGLTKEEKQDVLQKAKAFCDKHKIELVTNIPPKDE